MRLPRPRLTIQRLMILVAIGAMIAWGWIEGDRRRQRFQGQAWRYGQEFASLHNDAILNGHEADPARSAWLDDMRQKYRVAARYPWLPVWPDSPEPR